MALKHDVYDTGTPFLIDPVSRTITNESLSKICLIQYDHNSECFTFKMPRYVDGHDMSLCDIVQIHYINVDAKTKEQSRDVYEVTDLHVSQDENDVVVFSWLISCKATKYFGYLTFSVRFSCTDDNGKIQYVWNTTTCPRLPVSACNNNGESVIEEYSDILESWKAEITDDILNSLPIAEEVSV